MKKIMFNDRYGLTKAVLEGRKTMTRRIVRNPEEVEINGHAYLKTEKLHYKVGEVVAVAQCLKDMEYNPRDTKTISGAIWGIDHEPAWTNKMFVPACLCIHQIRITNVRVERLKDISEEDCIREGLCWTPSGFYVKYEPDTHSRIWLRGMTHRSAFAELIDKVSGKGTWENNPYVFVYEFELVK